MPGGSSQSWDALLGTIDPATSSLDVDFTALSSGNGGLSKEVTVNEDEFSITINFSNFTVTPGQSDDVIVVGVVENNDATNGNALGRAFLAGMGVRMGVENNACLAMFGTSDSDTTDFSQRCATDGAYSVRLTYSSGQVETFYSTNGTDFPSMGTATTDIDISQLGYAIISFIRQYGSNTAQIDSVVFEGATSTTQY